MKQKKIKKFRKNLNDFLFDHFILKEFLNNSYSVILSTLAGIVYAFGFCCFVVPAAGDLTIVTGGVGGISQNIALIVEVCGGTIDAEQMQSIFYFVINIPICTFGFFAIGKRFGLVTLLNVGLSSVFIMVFKQWDFVLQIRQTLTAAQTIDGVTYLNYGNIVVRTLFAGIFVGTASGIAFKADVSCGGIDVFSYYFGMRKSTSVGKYTATINAIIVLLYTAVLGFSGKVIWSKAFVSLLFSVAYLFITMLVVDLINTRNKKISVQIITDRADLSKILISIFPHAATISNVKGAYSNKEKYMITMVISSNEVKKLVLVCKQADEHAFVSINSLIQVYGNFFTRPIE